MGDIFLNRSVIGKKLFSIFGHSNTCDPLVHFHFSIDTQITNVFWTFCLNFWMLKKNLEVFFKFGDLLLVSKMPILLNKLCAKE